MLVPRFRFRRAPGAFQWLAESRFNHGDVYRHFVALDRSRSVVKEFAAAVRWAERVGKIKQFVSQEDDLSGFYGYDSCQFLSRARLNSMANRRSDEHARFMALDGAYRTAFINWAGWVKPSKELQQASGMRTSEDAEDTRNSKEFIYRESRNRLTEFMLRESNAGFPLHWTYGLDEPFGEAGSRAILKSCDCH